jgi:hypothetical protein
MKNKWKVCSVKPGGGKKTNIRFCFYSFRVSICHMYIYWRYEEGIEFLHKSVYIVVRGLSPIAQIQSSAISL